jgi:hypothetical protein
MKVESQFEVLRALTSSFSTTSTRSEREGTRDRWKISHSRRWSNELVPGHEMVPVVSIA